jgi:hypothetical protein
MCSGCFGEYEENDDSESPSAAGWSVSRFGAGSEDTDRRDPDDGDDHLGDETHGSGRGVFDEGEFEVLVGLESIVEIRWISAKPLGPRAYSTTSGAVTPVPERAQNQHSQGASAKNYQTALTRYCVERFARVGSKYVLAGALTLFFLGALAFWFFRA